MQSSSMSITKRTTIHSLFVAYSTIITPRSTQNITLVIGASSTTPPTYVILGKIGQLGISTHSLWNVVVQSWDLFGATPIGKQILARFDVGGNLQTKFSVISPRTI